MANAAAALVAAATAAGAAVAAPPAASQPAARGVATAEQPAVPIMPATAVWPPSAEALGWPLQFDSVALWAQHGAVPSQPAWTGPPWDNNASRRRVDGGRAFGAEAGAWLLVHPIYNSNPRQSGPYRAPPMRPSGMLCAAHVSLHLQAGEYA